MKIPLKIIVMGCIAICISCKKSKVRELSLADYTHEELEQGAYIRSRVMGIWQDGNQLVREEKQKGKLKPDEILRLLLAKENSWEWKNPYTKQVSKVVVEYIPSKQGDVSISLMPPWKDALQVQHPHTIWIRARIKVGTIEDIAEKAIPID